jgi:integrase
VIAQDNDSPYDVKDLSKRFKRFIRKNGLREVDFYSLRHASVTAKLRATHDVKAVQGDTGHSIADMLQNVYSAFWTKTAEIPPSR